MSDKLLFQSGSAKVDKRGKEALAKLAEVLNKQNDIDVYIEGHTDSKPINTAQFKDNWDLSVIRATSVVRILTKDYGAVSYTHLGISFYSRTKNIKGVRRPR